MAIFDHVGILIGESAAMRSLRTLILRIAPTRLPVLIHGPTGAGKELVAHALHLHSARHGNFVPFNVCAIAETMFEDTLFGHEKGAFTGAVTCSSGYMAEADGGTLFLDEISGLGAAQQAKLLRVLETGMFRPLGARRDSRSEFRVVAATNEDLADLVQIGRFRADLLHRLNGVTIHVPALHDRREDIPMLVRHFLTIFSPDLALQVTASAMDLLRDHPWPGNVRELRHTMERIAAFAERPEVRREDVARALDRVGVGPSPIRSLARDRLVEVLQGCNWDPMRAAVVLNVHWTTVYRRMRRFGIARPDGHPPGAGGMVVREVPVLDVSANSHLNSANQG